LYPHVGSFGVKRRFDKHRGIDLYAPVGTEVYAVEDGIVKDIRPWTGKDANCDWWLDTDAVAVEGKSGLAVYGEIEIDKKIKLNKKIKAGQLIGTVKRVLKNDKGRPTSMLHFELRDYGFYKNIAKNWDSDIPEGIKDPTPFLKRSIFNLK
jgi:murein DD-endopeptidase MepM/ murein hydrolase activator NlpD